MFKVEKSKILVAEKSFILKLSSLNILSKQYT